MNYFVLFYYLNILFTGKYFIHKDTHNEQRQVVIVLVFSYFVIVIVFVYFSFSRKMHWNISIRGILEDWINLLVLLIKQKRKGKNY